MTVEIKETYSDSQIGDAISSANITIMRKAPFFGALLMGTDVKMLEEEAMSKLSFDKNYIPPACTDGMEVFICAAGMSKLIQATGKISKRSDESMVRYDTCCFVVLHEILHCAFMHIDRKGGRDGVLWNIATDISINHMITEMLPEVEAPHGLMYGEGLISKKEAQRSAEAIYELLLKQTDFLTITDNGDGTMTIKNDRTGESTTTVKDLNFDGAGQGKTSARERKDNWERKIQIAKTVSEKASRKAGKGSCRAEDELSKLYEPKIDWRGYICNIAQNIARKDYSFMRRSRRSITTPFIMPSLRSWESNVAIAMDVSGSVSREEFMRFMSETMGILKHFDCEIFVMQIDDSIVHEQWIDEYNNTPALTRKGCGGTTFEPAFLRLSKMTEKQFSALIYFTDGYNFDTGFENHYQGFPMPVLWVMTTDRDPPKIGTSVLYDKYS